jgi:hypothetical protein
MIPESSINLCHYGTDDPVMQHQTENEMGTTGANVTKTIELDAAGYEQYLEFVAHTKQRNVSALIKEAGDKVPGRRQTLVMRRVKPKEVAPDEDIAAYGQIHKLKKDGADPKKKVPVTDNEIMAYKVLDPEFKATPTLDAIKAKVEELKATGQANEEGDTGEEEEDLTGND